jgi:hypothetical protein
MNIMKINTRILKMEVYGGWWAYVLAVIAIIGIVFLFGISLYVLWMGVDYLLNWWSAPTENRIYVQILLTVAIIGALMFLFERCCPEKSCAPKEDWGDDL